MYHLPAFVAPCVRLIEEKIRGKAGVYRLAVGLKLICSVAGKTHRQVQIRGFCHQAAVFFKARICPVDIAMHTARAVFVAPVPRVPECHFILLP